MNRFNTLLITLTAASSMALAGDLDPPPGPVAPTMKALDVVEPRIAVNDENTPGDGLAVFRITEPGSYYLTANVQGVMGRHGIVIESHNVTLDLNGFGLIGEPGTMDGIRMEPPSLNGPYRCSVFNGSIDSWDGYGVYGFFAFGAQFRDLRIAGCGEHGIFTASGSTLTRVTSFENASGGFFTNGIATFRDCAASENSGPGFECQGTLVGCTAFNNIGPGFQLKQATATGCSSVVNTGAGFETTFEAVTMTDCYATLNGTSGFVLVAGGLVRGCVSERNAVDGFVAAEECTLIECQANTHPDDGFQIGRNCVVERCVSRANAYGFYTDNQDDQTVRECSAYGNSNSGFFVTGQGALLVKNHANGNGTDFDITGSTRYGPIVTAPGLIASEHPQANFASNEPVITGAIGKAKAGRR